MSGIVIGGVWLTFMALLVVVSVRNVVVSNFRHRLISAISEAQRVDINAGRFETWHDRWRPYETVSYESQVFQFWRPLASFWTPEDWGYMHGEVQA